MYKIDKPQIGIREFFDNCLPQTPTPHYIQALAIKEKIISYGQNYDKVTSNGNIHTLDKCQDYPVLIKIYNSIYSGAKRKNYDYILSLAHNNICPFCSHGPVATIDHFLSKKLYTPYALLPYNLVPCCSNCNKNKLEYAPTTKENTLIHPYYDDVQNICWLKAECLYSNGGYVISYYINKKIDQTTYARLCKQFELLKLGTIYSSQAARFLPVIKTYVKKMIDEQNCFIDDIKQYLNDEAERHVPLGINSWQYAMYEALAKSPDFCNGANF